MEQDRKKSGWKRIKYLLLAFLIILLVLLISFILLLLFFPRERIKALVENRLARELNSQVHIYTLKLDYIPSPKLVMNGIIISHPDTDDQIFGAREAVVFLNPYNFFRKGNPVTRLVLGSPVLHLRRMQNDEWNVQRMVADDRDRQPPEAGEDREQAMGPIIIRNGTINIIQQQTGRLFSIHDILATIRLAKDQILIEQASLIYAPLYADFEGRISDFSSPNLSLDLRISGGLAREGHLAEARDKGVRAEDRLAAFSATAVGTTDSVSISGDFSVHEELTYNVPTDGSLNGVLQPGAALLEVDDLTVRFGETSVSLSGTAKNLWGDERTADLSGTVRVLPEPLLARAGERIAEQIEPAGAAEGNVSLTAAMQTIELKTELNLVETALTIPNVMQKEIGEPGSLALNARYQIGQALVFDDIDLDIAGATISGSAKVQPGAAPWLEASLRTTDFPLERIDRAPAVTFQQGTVSLDAQLRQNARAEDMAYQVDANLQQAQLLAGPLTEPIRELNAQLNVTDSSAQTQGAQFAFADSRFSLDAQLSDFSAPNIEGTLQTERLDLDRMIAALRGREDEVEEEAPPAALPADFTLQLLIEAESVYAGGLLTGPVTTTMKTSGETYTFDPLSITIFGGEIQGIADVNTEEEQTRWRVNLEAADMQIEPILTQFSTGPTTVNGVLNAHARLSGIAGAREDLVRSIQGEIEGTARDGRVIQSPVLTTIINLTQVPIGSAIVPGLREIIIANTVIDLFRTRGRSIDITSVSYTTIEGRFSLANGVARTEDFRFNSGTVDLTAAGEINYLDDSVNMRVSATPLGAITSIVGEIPIIGAPLRGAREVFSTNFAVTGSLSNPSVRPTLFGGAPPAAPEQPEPEAPLPEMPEPEPREEPSPEMPQEQEPREVPEMPVPGVSRAPEEVY